jgi:hypothetical protein
MAESTTIGAVDISMVAQCERDGGTGIVRSVQRIDDSDALASYVTHIDFTLLREKLTLSPEEGGTGWSVEQAQHVEVKYKRWLLMKHKYDNVLIPPPRDVDTFWHGHIVDTQAYWRDTNAIFGQYFHHYPYFGMRGKADREKLDSSFENTKRIYREMYGEEITD